MSDLKAMADALTGTFYQRVVTPSGQAMTKKELRDAIDSEGIERVVYAKSFSEMREINAMLVAALSAPTADAAPSSAGAGLIEKAAQIADEMLSDVAGGVMVGKAIRKLAAPPATQTAGMAQSEKCTYCFGLGKYVPGGLSAHQSNWRYC